MISSTTRRGSMPVRLRIAATVVTAAGSSTWRAAMFTAILPRRPGRRLLARLLQHPPAHRHDGPGLLGERDERLRAAAGRAAGAASARAPRDPRRSTSTGRRWAAGARPSRRRRPRPARRRRAPAARRPMVRIPCSNSSTRAFPLPLAAYMARSASCSAPAPDSYCATGQARGSALTRRSRPATENGTSRAASTRCASSGPSAMAVSPSTRMANSSPPIRATVSPRRTHARSRSPTDASRRSPASWPRLSLTVLKSSRSTKSTDTGSSRRCWQRVVEPIAEERPVGQERERVVEGLELELHLPLLQLGDRPLEVAGELAVLEDRHDLAHDEQDRDDAADDRRGTVRRRPRTSTG